MGKKVKKDDKGPADDVVRATGVSDWRARGAVRVWGSSTTVEPHGRKLESIVFIPTVRTSLQFDPLLVESRQAQTVVLMLNSDEDDVLAKACEAIYKFVDKCDENRVALLDLGAIDALLRLIEHEDKVVRRNACMCLGVMASQGEKTVRSFSCVGFW